MRQRLKTLIQRPASLEYELSKLKIRFKCGGLAVEAYIKQEPYKEWKSWFLEAVCRIIRRLKPGRRVPDEPERLASPVFCRYLPALNLFSVQIDHVKHSTALAVEERRDSPFWLGTEVPGHPLR